jgi:hypothetical protein
MPTLRRSSACAGALALLLTLLLGACTTPTVNHQPTDTPEGPATRADFPTVDPGYIYDQLFTMATRYVHREAGYDTGLPPDQNGHDEFAAYWAQEMTKQLDGFGPTVRQDSFPVDGWVNRPAPVPAFNVEVTVPGVTHPEQMVVIGCHYDGEAVSTQSANDDGSGCAIELGVAKALAEYWRAHKVYPARTLRFVLFDAEEQGLFGSFHYLNDTINGETGQIVAMINEEQNGIAYPLRFLGQTSNPILPLYVDETPLSSNRLYQHQDQLSAAQRQRITRFRDLMSQAVPAVFTQFRAIGDASLSYHGTNGDESQPIFQSGQTSNVRLEDDDLGSSDQVPFTLAGVACATPVGNSSYYDGQGAPPWSYPFDQREDTIQLMNVYASGKEAKAPALVLALGLPGMLTTWMLHQSDILGEASADGKPIATIGDIGQTVAGQSLALDAKAAYLPGGSGSLSYAWSFGDGASANGVAVQHSYSTPGNYTLQLTVSAGAATRQISVPITVGSAPPSYPNPYARFPSDGSPPPQPNVQIPTPVP